MSKENKTNAEYWSNRISNSLWKYYNDAEKRNKALLEMYQESILDIDEELYKILSKINGGNPTLTDMYNNNRLDKLKENINKIIADLKIKVNDHATDILTDAINVGYEKSIKTLDKNNEYSMPNKKLVEKMLRDPWIGENFSQNIWRNTYVLERNLNDLLKTGLIQGKTIESMSKDLKSRMMVSFKACHRLIRNETMHYLNAAAKMAYSDQGIEYVEFFAAEDERTCEGCGMLHQKIFPIDKAPMLPFHVNCRCTYIPVLSKVDNKKETKKDDKKDVKKDKAYNAAGKEIVFNLDGMKDKAAKRVKDTITELSNIYNTSVVSVNKGTGKGGQMAGYVDAANNLHLSSTKKETIVHEFAHTLSSTSREKLNLSNDKNFWKEIKKVRNEYNKAIKADQSKVISNYASDNADEFIAEAFTHAYLKDTGELNWGYGNDHEYSFKVLEVIDKYFKK